MQQNLCSPLALKTSVEVRRRLERFDLRVPAKVEAIGRSKEIQHLMTRNVSADGAFLESIRPFFQNTSVRTVLKLPNGAEIKVDGLVLRSEPTGMAIRFDEGYKIVSPRTN